MKLIFLCMALVMLSSPARAGADGSDTSHAMLSLRTPGRSALVTIDSVFRGYTPLTVDSLTVGKHVVRLVGLPVTRWAERPVVDTVDLSGGERRDITYDIPMMLRISSLPSGAAAWLRNSLLGVTPLLVSARDLHPGDTLVLRAAGFEQSAVTAPDTIRQDILVPLTRTLQTLPQVPATPELAKNGDRPPFQLIVPIAGTVIAGTIAAYCKIHADNVNDQYLTSGNGILLSEVRHYDLISAIALVIAETGMALLAYYLLSP